MSKLPSVLVFVPYYLPGYKSGGPVRTVSSIVDSCGDDFKFSVITRDRDSGDIQAYDSVKVNDWNLVGKSPIFYANSKKLTYAGLYDTLASSNFDAFYLNSFFHPVFTIKPLLLNQLFFRKPVIICPRGEFSQGALGLKSFKKRFYLKLTKLLGVHKRLFWQATTEDEASLIRSIFGDCVKIKIAQNISLPLLLSHPFPPKSSPLKIVFLSRISHMKNILGALRSLSKVTFPSIFDIYGPASRSQDKAYLKECQAFATTLPPHIQVNFKGEMRHEMVGDTLKRYDLFFMPTLGENFGHAILEALAAGLPILIGNTTPWKNLSNYGVGWDLEPDDITGFAEKIDEVAVMSVKDHVELREAALHYAQDYLESNEAVAQTRNMFYEMIQNR